MKDILCYLPTGIFVEHGSCSTIRKLWWFYSMIVMIWKTKDAAVQYDGFKRIEPGMDIGWI